MKQILFICPYPLEQSPSQRFRFEQYFDILAANDTAFEVSPFLSITEWNILYTNGKTWLKIKGVISGLLKRTRLLFSIHRFDYIFIHREAAPIGPPIFEWIIAKIIRKKIIYDFDDAIWLPNVSESNKVISWLKWNRKVRSICGWSYKVSCGNEFLASFARKHNSSVIINPTTIDTKGLHNPALYNIVEKSAKIIGWTGTHSTLQYVAPFLPIIEALWNKYPHIELLIIADKDPQWNKSFVRFVRWTKETEMQDLIKIDIGIMPLTDDLWAKGKCGFKALQYMALEKPAVASPVGINVQIIDDGINGYLCLTDKEWFQRLEHLVLNSSIGNEMGRKGRQNVVDHYSVISNSSNFLLLFE